MDQGSDLISDFRARRIRTSISWENLSANCHEVTEFRIVGSGTGSAGAGSGNEGNKATKNGGMIAIKFSGINSQGQALVDHAPSFSGLHTKLRCSTHQASAVWVGVVGEVGVVGAVGVVLSSPDVKLTARDRFVSPARDLWPGRDGSQGTLRDHSITRQLEPIQFICVITAGSQESCDRPLFPPRCFAAQFVYKECSVRSFPKFNQYLL